VARLEAIRSSYSICFGIDLGLGPSSLKQIPFVMTGVFVEAFRIGSILESTMTTSERYHRGLGIKSCGVVSTAVRVAVESSVAIGSVGGTMTVSFDNFLIWALAPFAAFFSNRLGALVAGVLCILNMYIP
jgi:hypothetical protein